MDRYAPRVSLKLPDRGWPNSEQALQLASFNFRRRLNTTVYPTGAHVPKETIYRQTTVLSLNGGIKPHQGHEMILTQYRRSSLLSIILLFAIASMVSAEDNWVLLHRGQGGDRDVYYDKQSIRKIDGSIMEVYIKVLDARNRHSVQQVQIDTENQKLASGLPAA